MAGTCVTWYAYGHITGLHCNNVGKESWVANKAAIKQVTLQLMKMVFQITVECYATFKYLLTKFTQESTVQFIYLIPLTIMRNQKFRLYKRKISEEGLTTLSQFIMKTAQYSLRCDSTKEFFQTNYISETSVCNLAMFCESFPNNKGISYYNTVIGFFLSVSCQVTIERWCMVHDFFMHVCFLISESLHVNWLMAKEFFHIH